MTSKFAIQQNKLSNQLPPVLQEIISRSMSETKFYKSSISLGIDEKFLVGHESDLVLFEIAALKSCITQEEIPITEHDTIVREMLLRYGRADIVILHVDGTATVIEAKDGRLGYGHVVSGIGQVSLYATQLAAKRVGIKQVRRCLLWSSTENYEQDCVIEEACIYAGVIPMRRIPVREMRAIHMLQKKIGIDALNKLAADHHELNNAYCEFMRSILDTVNCSKEIRRTID